MRPPTKTIPLVTLDEPVLLHGVEENGRRSLWAKLRDRPGDEWRRWTWAPITDLEWLALVEQAVTIREVMDKDEARVVEQRDGSPIEAVELIPERTRDEYFPRSGAKLPLFVLDENPALRPPIDHATAIHFENGAGHHRLKLRDLGALATALSNFMDAHLFETVSMVERREKGMKTGSVDAIATAPGSFAVVVQCAHAGVIERALEALRSLTGHTDDREQALSDLRQRPLTRIKLATLMRTMTARRVSMYARVDSTRTFVSFRRAGKVREHLGVAHIRDSSEPYPRLVDVLSWDLLNAKGVVLDIEQDERIAVTHSLAIQQGVDPVLVGGRYFVNLNVSWSDDGSEELRPTYQVARMQPETAPSPVSTEAE